ncbi:hypothetical protein KCH_45720 [Kitasatospora cheerisanensis KCTC 2395]|uniref:MFS transporter n=1 Tax=Kitasatospora cheerisanensis KCTC 2395 TaxID=1348663 RepID=A0A066YQU4_9ACTN|nr:hypothetical protein KCH_45720 [Kitasatospora cheerisanensis KCTC 2395]
MPGPRYQAAERTDRGGSPTGRRHHPHRLRALLRTPRAWTFLLPALVARLPYAMLGLGIVLLVRDTTGSYGLAGGVAAVAAVAQALIGPQTGRLADRHGQAAVLVPAVLVHAAAVAALIALAHGGAPDWTLFLAAAPPARPCRRSAPWSGPAG